MSNRPGGKNVRIATHPSRVDDGAHQIGGDHPSHPIERHASSLCFQTVQDDAVADEEDRAQTKGKVVYGAPASPLGTIEARMKSEEAATEGGKAGLSWR